MTYKEGITILTGPNGYGKTTILNIIYNFFKQNFLFFKRLNFEIITLNEKFEQLQEFGIVISNIKIQEYNESKADFFNELVSKINLFNTIIKEKFTHKKNKNK